MSLTWELVAVIIGVTATICATLLKIFKPSGGNGAKASHPINRECQELFSDADKRIELVEQNLKAVTQGLEDLKNTFKDGKEDYTRELGRVETKVEKLSDLIMKWISEER